MTRVTDDDLDEQALASLLRDQGGVVARRQVLELGGTDLDIRRKLRRREGARIETGVYVDHTGIPSWKQRAWAAVLRHWPAALHRESALHAHGFGSEPRASEPIHLMVDRDRAGSGPAVEIERVLDPDRWILAGLRPPRARFDFALVKVASVRAPTQALALLGDACQKGKTTAQRLVEQVEQLPRLPQRAFLLEVLADVATGTYSVLEHRYLTLVERAHELPAGQRQFRATTEGRSAYRDVRYPEQQALVELDGRLGHEEVADRWSDLDRDLAAAIAEEVTVRLGWKQVLEPCRLAARMAALLRARGWTGVPVACSDTCPLSDDVAA